MKSLSDFVRAYGRTLEHHEDSGRTAIKTGIPIVVSRQYGSGGFLVAKRLAQHYGYELFDKNLLEEVAKKAKVPGDFVRMLDERVGGALEFFGAGLLRQTVLAPSDFPMLLKGTLKALIKLGSVVIVGRGAAFLVEPGSAARIKYVAPLDVRSRNVAEREGISVDQAREMILQVEKDREKFLQRTFGHSLTQDDFFDLVINTAT
jgi:cytidylate kinase